MKYHQLPKELQKIVIDHLIHHDFLSAKAVYDAYEAKKQIDKSA